MKYLLKKKGSFKLFKFVTMRSVGDHEKLFVRYDLYKGKDRIAGYSGSDDEKAIKWYDSELSKRYNL